MHAFHNTFKLCLSVRYDFILSFLIALAASPGYSGTVDRETSVLFLDRVILTCLAPDLSTVNVIFSYDVKHNSEHTYLKRLIYFNITTDKTLSLALLYINKCSTIDCSCSNVYTIW